MTAPHQMFDRDAILRNRARALRIGFADFLHREALFELQERMLDVNRRFNDVAIVSGFPNFWRDPFPNARHVVDDDTLDLIPQSCDLVVHAMCLHQSNDPVGQIIQCRRALRPDGLLLVATLGGTTLTELRSALGQAEVDLAGGLSPRVSPMAEIRDLGSVLQRSKLALPVADGVKTRVTYSDFYGLSCDLRAMGESNAMTARQRKIPPRDLFEQTDRIYRDAFPADKDRIAASFEIIFLTAWAPSADQPKPLQPGSAKKRLADALGATELGLDVKPGNGNEDRKR